MAGNPGLLVALAGLRSVLFPIPVITLFWRDHIGMSFTDIMVLQAIFGLAVVVLEFPSGYLADRVGHRQALLVAAVLWALGWLLYARGVTFAQVVLAEVVLGGGLAFASGADSALLYRSLAASGREAAYPRHEGRVRAAAQACESLSAAGGGSLYALAPRLPFWLQVPTALVALGVTAALREERPAGGTGAHHSHLAHALAVVRLAGAHPRLRAAMALSVTLGLATFVMVWLFQPYMRQRGIPEPWFGPVWAAAHLWLAGVSMASGRIAELLGVRATLVGCWLLVPCGYGLLAVSGSPWAAAFYLCLMTVRGLQGPILAHALLREAPVDDRASVLSLNTLLFRLAFVVAGPPIGRLVDQRGLDQALIVLAVGLALPGLGALVLFLRSRRDAG
jgi:predicted MFS family arabinose efflux permease